MNLPKFEGNLVFGLVKPFPLDCFSISQRYDKLVSFEETKKTKTNFFWFRSIEPTEKGREVEMTMACALSALDDLYRTKVSGLEDIILLLQCKVKKLEQYKDETAKLQAENIQLVSALSRAKKRRLNRCDTCLEKRRAAELNSFKARIRKLNKQSATSPKLSIFQNFVQKFIPLL